MYAIRISSSAILGNALNDTDSYTNSTQYSEPKSTPAPMTVDPAALNIDCEDRKFYYDVANNKCTNDGSDGTYGERDFSILAMTPINLIHALPLHRFL